MCVLYRYKTTDRKWTKAGGDMIWRNHYDRSSVPGKCKFADQIFTNGIKQTKNLDQWIYHILYYTNYTYIYIYICVCVFVCVLESVIRVILCSSFYVSIFRWCRHSIYIYIYIYRLLVKKYLALLKIFLFLILTVFFFTKQVKHHNIFIYYTKYKSFWATLNAD